MTYTYNKNLDSISKNDLLKAYSQPHTEKDFVIPGLRAGGSVGAIIAPGGTGKSFLALEIAHAVACPQADLAGFKVNNPGKVLYLNAEDLSDETDERLSYLGKYYSMEIRNEVAKNLDILSVAGEMINLSNHNKHNPISDHLSWLINKYKGYRLIILDTFSLFHTLDENRNDQMAYMISCLKYLGTHTGASILFLHHTNKQSSREGQLGYQTASRGADAIIANIRYASYLSFMSKEEALNYENINPENHKFYLKFGVSKQNYGMPEPERWLKRMEGGVLRTVTLTKAEKHSQNVKSNIREIFYGEKV
jgi:RecA-family ATPase